MSRHAARARAIGQWRADAWYCRQAVTFPVRFRLADVALALLASPEGRLVRVAEWYQHDLARAESVAQLKTDPGVAAWAAQLVD